MTDLIQLIKSRDENKILAELGKYSGLKGVNPRLLYDALKENLSEKVLLKITSLKPLVNPQNVIDYETGRTVISLAVKKYPQISEKVLEEIISLKPDLSNREDMAFSNALKKGLTEKILLQMLSLRPELNIGTDETTPLMIAITNPKISDKVILQMLNMNPELENDYSQTSPLQASLRAKRDKVILKILERVEVKGLDIQTALEKGVSDKIVLKMLETQPDLKETEIIEYVLSHQKKMNPKVIQKILELQSPSYSQRKYILQNREKMSPQIVESVSVAKKVLKMSKDNFYKWQDMCSIFNVDNVKELQKIAKEHSIDSNDKTKRQLCYELANSYQKELEKPRPACLNDKTLSGEKLNKLHPALLFSIQEGKLSFCFSIIELHQMISTGYSVNPYTGKVLPIEEIKKRYSQISKLVSPRILSQDQLITKVLKLSEKIRIDFLTILDLQEEEIAQIFEIMKDNGVKVSAKNPSLLSLVEQGLVISQNKTNAMMLELAIRSVSN